VEVDMKLLAMIVGGIWCTALSGCAGFDVEGREGIRVYDPAYYVVVSRNGNDFKTQTFVGPNLCSHYEIKPKSFFAKNEFSLRLTDGMASQVADELDTTAILTFFQSAAEKAMEAAASAVGGTDAMNGRAMDGEGIWIWTGHRFVKMGPGIGCAQLAAG
jgi:hypothetical protein